MKPEVKIVVGGLLLVVGVGSVVGGLSEIKKVNDRKELEAILYPPEPYDDGCQFMYGVDEIDIVVPSDQMD